MPISIKLDYKWIEALSEFASRLCSEDEQKLISSQFASKFTTKEHSENNFKQSGLSPRLKDVYECLLENLSNKEIAAKLSISHHTVNDYAKQVLAHELEKAVLERPEIFVNALTEKLFIYAMGRGVEPEERVFVRQAVKAAEKENYSIHSLITEIVKSPLFKKLKGH